MNRIRIPQQKEWHWMKWLLRWLPLEPRIERKVKYNFSYLYSLLLDMRQRQIRWHQLCISLRKIRITLKNFEKKLMRSKWRYSIFILIEVMWGQPWFLRIWIVWHLNLYLSPVQSWMKPFDYSHPSESTSGIRLQSKPLVVKYESYYMTHKSYVIDFDLELNFSISEWHRWLRVATLPNNSELELDGIKFKNGFNVEIPNDLLHVHPGKNFNITVLD